MLELGCAGPAGSAADLAHDREADLDALADRLHDGPAQALVAARYAIDVALAGDRQALAGARAAVQDALVAVRRMSWLARPRALDGNLDGALVELSEQLHAAGGPALVVLGTARLDPALAVAVYRLAQLVTDGADPQDRVTAWLGHSVEFTGVRELDHAGLERLRRRIERLGGRLEDATDGLRVVHA